MKLNATRSNVRLNPDFKKVIPRFFNTGDVRSKALINRVLQMPDKETDAILQQVIRDFRHRYKDVRSIFDKHFDRVKHLVSKKSEVKLTEEKRLLIGSYFTMEYSLEAAALFNPSIVEDPDQSGAGPGEKNIILSFRATGESHISSLVFRKGRLSENSSVHIDPSGNFMTEGIISQQIRNNKTSFEALLKETLLPVDIRCNILSLLQDKFTYKEIESVLKNELQQIRSVTERKKLKYDILSMVNTSHEVNFLPDSELSERVIFPVTFTEKNGIEDARFVKFVDEDGAFRYIATYTAYDGSFILPHLIETKNFIHFKVSALHGKAAINKNLALFPRKINGQYAMMARIDGINNYIMFSNDLYLWEDATVLQEPKYPWEFVQIGNGGSPIETERGWLLITHGVGPMRRYCLGACLLDLNDPMKIVGRLREPILMPNEDERHGYVPNVVYSCGSIVHQDKLFIPYALSDRVSTFATIPLKDLLAELSEGA
jgi:predicted GH43/DUF377 family glycosyl hydrolase